MTTTITTPASPTWRFFSKLRWLDGRPLLETMEPYRLRLFKQFFDTRGAGERLVYNLLLAGRAKKNWKTADLVLACYFALFSETSTTGSQVYVVANDEDQADDDLDLARKLRKANGAIESLTTVKRNVIERKDGAGFIEVLPAQDALGQHGKTYRLLAVDEIHGYRNWDLLEALALDPTRDDAQQFITSYASLHHVPGAPLHDMMKSGRAGTDPRMLFSWYAADFTTDPAFVEATPEDRANPSRGSWENPDYLDQQRRRLPTHKFRRLHLNLPGLPEGSPFQPDAVSAAIARGVTRRSWGADDPRVAFVDMSGGSNDDATLAIARRLPNRHGELLYLGNQGQPVPFDPRRAVERFVDVLRDFDVRRVTMDQYAGLTFRMDFERYGIGVESCRQSASDLYEAFEPKLNAGEVQLLDLPLLEQQLLGLQWKGGKITHPNGEHDDWANAAVGALIVATRTPRGLPVGAMRVDWLL